MMSRVPHTSLLRVGILVLRVPHASGLRVGILVLFYAEGFEALLRAWRFTFSHV
jgi:hypothetical protein